MPAPKAGLKPGVPVVIGGETYTCPELDFGAIRGMADLKRYSRVDPGSGKTVVTPDAHELMAYILLQSLRRNYEGCNAVWLNETLLGSEIEDAAKAELEIMRNSGLRMSEEPDTPGEAKAVTG